MRGVHLLMFVVLWPALAALGHDAWLYSQDQDMGFKMAALGWIWTNYEPESYKWVVEQTEPLGYWPYINFVLAQKAVYVGLAFAGIIWLLIGILRIFGVGSEKEVRNFSGNRKIDEMMGRTKGSKMKYNRK